MDKSLQKINKRRVEILQVQEAIKTLYDISKNTHEYNKLHDELFLFITAINKIAHDKNNRPNKLEQGFIHYLKEKNIQKRSIEKILQQEKQKTQKIDFGEYLTLWLKLKSEGYSLRQMEKYTLTHLGIKVSKTTIGNKLKEQKDLFCL